VEEEVKHGNDDEENLYSNARECRFLMTDQGASCVAKYDYKAGKDGHPLSIFFKWDQAVYLIHSMYFV